MSIISIQYLCGKRRYYVYSERRYQVTCDNLNTEGFPILNETMPEDLARVSINLISQKGLCEEFCSHAQMSKSELIGLFKRSLN